MLSWLIGYRCPDKNLVLDERRNHSLSTEDMWYENPDGSGSLEGAVRKSKPSCAIIPWTQAREDVLAKAEQQLKDLQKQINNLVMSGQAEALLDGQLSTNLLLAPKVEDKKDE